MNKSNWDIVIVGSGFGGAVSALRLAQKGYNILVIEKGKRYESKDFPKSNWNLKKYFWMPNLFLYGIQCITLLKNIFVLKLFNLRGHQTKYFQSLSFQMKLFLIKMLILFLI